MLTSRRHITERYVVLPHKDLRNASSSLQGDAQLTLAYDMMITAANKNDRALQQPLTAAPRSQEQGYTAKVEYPASASLVSVQDARSQVPSVGSHVLSSWSQVPDSSISLLISGPRFQVKVPIPSIRPQVQIPVPGAWRCFSLSQRYCSRHVIQCKHDLGTARKTSQADAALKN